MSNLHPINQTLLTFIENQTARTTAALADLPSAVYEATPGGDCNSIRAIGEHLVGLRRFQLDLLRSPLATEVPKSPAVLASPEELERALSHATSVVERAIAEHDPDDWNQTPGEPRPGPWADEPTLARLVRPLNDFVNHLGAVRAIRRIHGAPSHTTQ